MAMARDLKAAARGRAPRKPPWPGDPTVGSLPSFESCDMMPGPVRHAESPRADPSMRKVFAALSAAPSCAVGLYPPVVPVTTEDETASGRRPHCYDSLSESAVGSLSRSPSHRESFQRCGADVSVAKDEMARCHQSLRGRRSAPVVDLPSRDLSLKLLLSVAKDETASCRRPHCCDSLSESQFRAARSAAPPVVPATVLASSAPSLISSISARAAHPAAPAASPTPSIGGRVSGSPAFQRNPLAGTGGFATSVSTVAGGQSVGASSVQGLLAASRAAALGALSPLGSAPHSGDLVDSPPSRSKVPQNPSSSLSQSAPAVVLASALALSAPSPIPSIAALAAHPAASAAFPTPSIGGRVPGPPAFQTNPIAGTGGFATSVSTVAGGQGGAASSVQGLLAASRAASREARRRHIREYSAGCARRRAPPPLGGPPHSGDPVDSSPSLPKVSRNSGSSLSQLALEASSSCAPRKLRGRRGLGNASSAGSRSDASDWRAVFASRRRRMLRRMVKRRRFRGAVDRLVEHAAVEVSLERCYRDCALSESIATPCSGRSLQPFTVSFSPELEAPEVVEALHCVPQLDDQSLDDFFEEPVADVERRLTLLSLGRNG